VVLGGVKVPIPKGRTLTGRAIDTSNQRIGVLGRGGGASIFSQELGDKLDDVEIWGWLRRRTSHHQQSRDSFFGNPIEAHIILLRIDPFYWILGSIPPAPLDKGGADRRGDLTTFNAYLLNCLATD